MTIPEIRYRMEKRAVRIFFDLEFTGLHQATTLVSLGMVSEDGRQFYAEATDYDRSQVSGWIKENVISRLFLEQRDGELPFLKSPAGWSIRGKRGEISIFLREWLAQFDSVEMWGDVLAYDWVVFCELFEAVDTAERLPRNVYYIPFDIATLMKVKGIDPDISREEFSGVSSLAKHNALDDARIIKACFKKLENL